MPEDIDTEWNVLKRCSEIQIPRNPLFIKITLVLKHLAALKQYQICNKSVYLDPKVNALLW